MKEFPTVEEDILFLDELYAKFQTAGIDVLEGGNMLEKEVEEPHGKKNVYLGKSSDASYDSIKMYLKEIFAGRYAKAPDVTEFPNVEQLNELMIVGPIRVRSACSHHLCPIIGSLWVGVMPNRHSNLIGLSKYARLAEWIMCRPQIQEEAVAQVADLLQEKMNPDGLAIVMEAEHLCMHWRGVRDTDAKMTNSVMRGSFLKDDKLRREFLTLLNLNRR